MEKDIEGLSATILKMPTMGWDCCKEKLHLDYSLEIQYWMILNDVELLL
jgi:hypothetical protein